MIRTMSTILAMTFLVGVLAACAAPNPKLAGECERMLSLAESRLAAAKAKGFSSGVSITKATALISAARIQQQFDKYPNCIDKAKRAIAFINLSKTE
jgi:hypothetical protein